MELSGFTRKEDTDSIPAFPLSLDVEFFGAVGHGDIVFWDLSALTSSLMMILMLCRAGLENRADLMMLAVIAAHLPALKAAAAADLLLGLTAADRAPCVHAAAAEALGVLASEHLRRCSASAVGLPQGNGHIEHSDESFDMHQKAAHRAAQSLLILLCTEVEFFSRGDLKAVLGTEVQVELQDVHEANLSLLHPSEHACKLCSSRTNTFSRCFVEQGILNEGIEEHRLMSRFDAEEAGGILRGEAPCPGH